MKTPHNTRTALLSAVTLLAVSLDGSGQATKVMSYLSWGDTASYNGAPHDAQQAVALAPTLEQLVEPFNFRDVDSATAFVQQHVMNEQLSGRGLSKGGRGFVDGQQIDTWYSAAEDRSVVCVRWIAGGRHSQAVSVMAGKIRRPDIVPLP